MEFGARLPAMTLGFLWLSLPGIVAAMPGVGDVVAVAAQQQLPVAVLDDALHRLWMLMAQLSGLYEWGPWATGDTGGISAADGVASSTAASGQFSASLFALWEWMPTSVSSSMQWALFASLAYSIIMSIARLAQMLWWFMWALGSALDTTATVFRGAMKMLGWLTGAFSCLFGGQATHAEDETNLVLVGSLSCCM